MARLIGPMIVLIFIVGCSQQAADQAGNISKSATPVAFNEAGAPTVEFTVPDMMCPEGCGAKVKEILAQQPGAKDVLVDFDSKIVTVAIDKEKFDAGQAVAALVDHQFGQSAIKVAASEDGVAKPQATEATAVH